MLFVSSFQYRTSVKVAAGTYPVTVQARQTGGPLVTIQHSDLFALGNLQ